MIAPPCPLCQSASTDRFSRVETSTYHRCPSCNLIFALPEHRLSPNEERSRYELHQNSSTDEGYRNFLSPLVDALVPKLDPGAVGLDFGAGPGPAVPVMFEEKGFEVCTYDPFFSPDRAVLSRSYDFIASSETFEHLFEPEKELRLLDSVLRPGGWIGIMTHFFDDPTTFAGSHYRRDPTHVSFYCRKTFEWVGKHLNWNPEFPSQNVVLFQKYV